MEDKTSHALSRVSMPAAKSAAIINRYLRDIATLRDNLMRVTQVSIPKIIVSEPIVPTDGPVIIRYEYDIKTQEQIDILRKHTQGITDRYRKLYPELFRFV